MLTKDELTTSIQTEIGDTALASVTLTDNLTSAESADRLEDVQEHLLRARYNAQMILSQINDQLARI